MVKNTLKIFYLLLILPFIVSAETTITYPDSITHHTITIDGKKYAYTTRAGIITIYQNYQPVADMFYTADTLDNTKSEERPITFFYNGGPGSSSMLLRMGAFGPKRILFNEHQQITAIPYRMIDNNYSLLDKTDMVFIDMPGTGFGRLTSYGKPKDFYTVDNDVNAFSKFILKYLRKNYRLNSPKFLFGESYGTTRTAILVNKLQSKTQINGIILHSAILNYGLMGEKSGGGDWQYVLYLPTLAATTWYFNASKYHPESLETLLKEVEHFATTEYLEALAEGFTLSSEKFNCISEKLHQYLGLPLEYIRHENLRVSSKQFSNQLLRYQHQRLGRFDTRFTFYSLEKNPSPINKRTIPIEEPADPASVAIKTATMAANENYLRVDLNYNPPQNYIPNLKISPQWGFYHNDQTIVNTSYDLATAMTQNSNLRVFSANGYYDMATPFFATVYTLNHLNLDSTIQNHITYGFYEGGHMMYIESKILKQYKKDLSQWYDATLAKLNN